MTEKVVSVLRVDKRNNMQPANPRHRRGGIRPHVPSTAAARRAAEHDPELRARAIARTTPQWYERATTADGEPYHRFYRLAANTPFRGEGLLEVIAWTDCALGGAPPVAGEALALQPMGGLTTDASGNVVDAPALAPMHVRVEQVLATEPGTRKYPFASAARLLVR